MSPTDTKPNTVVRYPTKARSFPVKVLDKQGAPCYTIRMKSLTNKAKFSAMQFARQNSDVKCVLYAKAGTLIRRGVELPQILKEGSFGYLDCMASLSGYDRNKVSIVTKSFFDNVLMPKARESVAFQQRCRDAVGCE